MSFTTKIATSLVLGALVAMPSTTAQRGGRTRGGGRGRGPGGPFANATFVDITCSSTGDLDLTCDPRGESEDGFFVCRTWTNSEGVERSKVKCIESARSIADVDECGCCGEDCPVVCDTCPCTTRHGTAGAYVLDADSANERFCAPLNAAMMMVFKKDDVSCLADCTLAE
ncbi:MAG: hypothetical protein SGBAC_011805 [Bacillariaceae sp.]